MIRIDENDVRSLSMTGRKKVFYKYTYSSPNMYRIIKLYICRLSALSSDENIFREILCGGNTIVDILRETLFLSFII